MKITRVIAEEYARQHGCEPVQVDGIPEGFSFKEPDLQIGENKHIGHYIALIPLAECGLDDPTPMVKAYDLVELLSLYNSITTNGK